MQNSETWVPIAKIGAPHGVRGFVRVFSLLDSDIDLSEYFKKPVLINHPDSSEPGMTLKIAEFRDTHKCWLVRFEPYSDRDQVIGLVHQNILVPHTELPELSDNQWYWRDLIGLSVFDQKNLETSIGVVTQLFETGADDVLEFEGFDVTEQKSKKYLIPFVLNRCIFSVDLKSQKIIIDFNLAVCD